MTRQTLGAYLRKARMDAGLSVRDVAAQTGISHGYLVKLENDQKEHPAADKLIRLAKALAVDESKLLAYIGVEPTAPEPKTYFRRHMGLNAREADILYELAEEIKAKRKEGGHEESN
ncbi:MAG TPA: helix-turn-helix domain-containing protein [Candidatus Saccharimonadales bacterium]|nr:helix-turn-helix domain-containing protein [Candidatus Saccharimonadales bacterium]